jgi:hypothetical protein
MLKNVFLLTTNEWYGEREDMDMKNHPVPSHPTREDALMSSTARGTDVDDNAV